MSMNRDKQFCVSIGCLEFKDCERAAVDSNPEYKKFNGDQHLRFGPGLDKDGKCQLK